MSYFRDVKTAANDQGSAAGSLQADRERLQAGGWPDSLYAEEWSSLTAEQLADASAWMPADLQCGWPAGRRCLIFFGQARANRIVTLARPTSAEDLSHGRTE